MLRLRVSKLMELFTKRCCKRERGRKLLEMKSEKVEERVVRGERRKKLGRVAGEASMVDWSTSAGSSSLGESRLGKEAQH